MTDQRIYLYLLPWPMEMLVKNLHIASFYWENFYHMLIHKCQILSEAKKPLIMDELQKLISDWTLKVVKCRKEEE